jgi:putative transposase
MARGGATMGHKPRQRSKVDIYHVMTRGDNRQLIFEDDIDRKSFLEILDRYLKIRLGTLLAWCLMDNHYHLLVRVPFDSLPLMMHDINLMYSKHFNNRHGNTGQLYEGRYRSVPVQDERQLLAEVFYIHRNAVEKGFKNPDDYAWCSHREYVRRPRRTFTELVLGIAGSVDVFEKSYAIYASEHPYKDECLELHSASDEKAFGILRELLGIDPLVELVRLSKSERNRLLCRALGHGFSVPQLSRLTGMGRTIVASLSRRVHEQQDDLTFSRRSTTLMPKPCT